jgi:poly-gamma-glutamate synthesis protein (capsule biosynthesis protein)
VEAVAADTAALGIVAGSAAGPGVRALRVAGTDPLRDPAPYALKVEGDAPARVVTAIAVGDVMLGRRVGARMARLGDFGAPFRRTAARLAAADLAFGNFESTLARGRPTVQPPGQSFAANPRALEGIRRAGLDLLSLANNHAADFGPASLLETLRLFEEARIATVGAGRDEARARAPAILERGGVRFGFLAFNAIGETPAPGAARPGAVRIRMQPRLGPLDRDDLEAFLADVRALRPRVDVLVVYPHWGRQYSHRAHPDQREVARAIVRAGVDLVVGTHPHWVGGAEIYRGKLIAYSLGNFVFDMDFSQKTQEGLALELVFWDGALKAAEFLPLRIGRDLAPRFLPWAAGRGILEDVWEASGTPFRLGPR